MSFNNFKLGLLLGLQFNHYSKNYLCQHYKCNCHHYRLLQGHNVRQSLSLSKKKKVLLLQLRTLRSSRKVLVRKRKQLLNSSLLSRFQMSLNLMKNDSLNFLRIFLRLNYNIKFQNCQLLTSQNLIRFRNFLRSLLLKKSLKQ